MEPLIKEIRKGFNSTSYRPTHNLEFEALTLQARHSEKDTHGKETPRTDTPRTFFPRLDTPGKTHQARTLQARTLL